MRNKPSGYPVGAKWKCVLPSGASGVVWLNKIDGTFEHWMWSSCFSDGSGGSFDWGTNKSFCVEECKISLCGLRSGKDIGFNMRFKRVKDKEA